MYQTQAPRGAARRDAILRAAIALVGEEGPDALTHRAVAERAGVAVSATTYWFSSKEEIFREAVALAAADRALRVPARSRAPARAARGGRALGSGTAAVGRVRLARGGLGRSRDRCPRRRGHHHRADTRAADDAPQGLRAHDPPPRARAFVHTPGAVATG